MWNEDDDRNRAVWDAQREQDLAERASVVRGLVIGSLLMIGFAYLIYRVMSWYLATMPPLRLH